MLFDKFVGEVHHYWDGYLCTVSRLQSEGVLRNLDGKRILFPSMILLTNCAGYYVCELLGASEKYSGLKVKRSSTSSIFKYLSQFDDSEPDPLFMLGVSGSFSFLTLSQSNDLDKVAERFPAVQFYKSAFLRENGHGSVFGFQEDFNRCIIDSCVLVNVSGVMHRCKNILHMMICRSSISSAGIVECYRDYMNMPEIKGVHCVTDDDEQRQLIAGHLQSLYLTHGLHETTLGEFFKLNPDIICRAFNTEKFHYEPYLRWMEHDGTCDDEAINPDLLVRRGDGYYDIYDLKTALLNKRNVTKGGRKRRRFIDYVEEGVAQLANYREYFNYPGNAVFAKEKYGIEVMSPNLVLVVGSWENSSAEEVDQACRRFPDIKIIDYDTLCHLFLGKNI